MNTLSIEKHPAHWIVSLNRGTSNPMNSEMVKELRALIHEVNIDPSVRGVILTGRDNFFSAGLDVIELYNYDEPTMKAFWMDLAKLVKEFVGSPKAWVAAVNGHSPAGGCVLALCCDYRIMTEGKAKIGLNEVPVGIIIPALIYHLYAYTLGNRLAYQYLMEGRLLEPQDALKVGLIDEVVPFEEVISRAEAQLAKYLALDQITWQQTKLNLRADLLKQLDGDFDATFEHTLRHWWSDQARGVLKGLVDRLTKK